MMQTKATRVACWVVVLASRSRIIDAFSLIQSSRLEHQRQAASLCLSKRLFTTHLCVSQKDFFTGAPSTPGFQPGEFDKLSSWALTTTSNRPVVAEYKPDVRWLWTQWEGTIRQMTWKSVVGIMLWAIAVNYYGYWHYTHDVVVGSVEGIKWYSSEIRHSSDDQFIECLSTISVQWEYNLTLVIFTLSFFVNQAYDHWKSVYFAARAIQGRINDICMLVTAGAVRTNEFGEVDGTTGYQSSDKEGSSGEKAIDSKTLVLDITRYLRLSHTFFWAATPTRSDGLARDVDLLEKVEEGFDPTQLGPKILSKEGLNALVNYGQLTQNEMDALLATNLSPSQYPYVLLQWANIRCMGALRTGELAGGPGLEDNLLRQFTALRGELFNIGDYASGRMSMAYIIAVEIVTDILVVSSPLALYPKMGAFSIIACGLLTISFSE
ncbi:hypothetical protein ACHAXR_010639 [Thalassiosira sp. AJA248-18]